MITSDSIQGWFDFKDIYQSAAKSFPDGAVFVEAGTWLGKSTIYLAEQLRANNKKIKIWAVDTFAGADTCEFHVETVKSHGGSILTQFWQNVKDCGVEDYILPICSKSEDCLDKIPEKEFDFVFLDSDHTFDVVTKELKLFWPRLKTGGVIGGHDFNQVEVQRAVNDFFVKTNPDQKIQVSNVSWFTIKT